MRADIHGGPEQKLQSEAGYIDARPLTTRSTKTSCNARPDHTSGSAPEIPRASRHLRFVPITELRRALNQCASLHGGALQVGTDDKRTAVVLSQIGNGLVDVEQAKMAHDELSDGRLLRNATDDCGSCV